MFRSLADHDQRDIDAGQHVRQIVVHFGQGDVAGLQLVIHRIQFFVGGLQLLLGRFQLLVARLGLFVGGFEFLRGRFLFLDNRLQVFSCGPQLLFQAGILPRAARAGGFRPIRSFRGGLGAFRLILCADGRGRRLGALEQNQEVKRIGATRSAAGPIDRDDLEMDVTRVLKTATGRSANSLLLRISCRTSIPSCLGKCRSITIIPAAASRPRMRLPSG